MSTETLSIAKSVTDFVCKLYFYKIVPVTNLPFVVVRKLVTLLKINAIFIYLWYSSLYNSVSKTSTYLIKRRVMRNNFSIKALISLTILIILTACQDHKDVPGIERFRLKKTTFTVPFFKQNTTVTYTYGNTGLLEKEISLNEFENAPSLTRTRTSIFTYNTQNRLIRIDRKENPDTDENAVTRFEFIYDNADNISTQLISVDRDSPRTGRYVVTSQTSYTYNSNRFPATLTTTLPQRPSSSTQSSAFTYTNGNLTQEVVSNTNDQPRTFVYQFDNKINPYYGIIRSEGILISFIASKNNFIKPNTIFTYNSKGLLIQENSTPPNGVPSQTVYDYETY